ncbi:MULTISPECIES: polysaccharide pyruvyl transferase family protein [Pseudomonas]|uniref:Polysaccharide pyruvyl transferase domain-containing protein n=1 Tax=Pseudomonas azotoformans TaxID=47878 RepID=A0A4Q0HCB2_PSEAZ|nr:MULTISPECIES: polysaccharide pyruvyl transferase family protein [Pseudomonas]RXE46251.1 hypothetical protein B4O85_28925 [Pseudomonas azotoformans]
MKIAIMTQPLGHNYGGLLQAFALQAYLKSIGCTVVSLDRKPATKPLKKTTDFTVSLAKRLLGRIKRLPSEKANKYVFFHLIGFKDRYLAMSEPVTTEKQVRTYFQQNNFDAVIVGSDQVWRPKYSPSLENYFLDFLDDIGSNAKRISCAASFGVSEWEFTEKQTRACKALLHKFDAISVREKSAVSLCKEYFEETVEWVIDPTMLLDVSDYEQLLTDVPSANKGNVLTYVLDAAEDKQKIAKIVAGTLRKKAFSVKPEKTLTQVNSSEVDKCQYPKVESWLQGFKDASYVVTDSFHGCVFSILFNKPFIAIGNRSRGQARFESLLSMFDLEDRLISTPDELNEDRIKEAIDWDRVNQIRMMRAQAGKEFLKNNIFQDGRFE